MQTIFTVFSYLTIKQKPGLRLNGMVTTAIMDFRIFDILLIWYDRAWQFIPKKYKFILWSSFFLQILDFKTWKIKTTSHKIYWDNPLPPFNHCWWVCKLRRGYAADKLLIHNIDIGEGEGALMEQSFKFFERKP